MHLFEQILPSKMYQHDYIMPLSLSSVHNKAEMVCISRRTEAIYHIDYGNNRKCLFEIRGIALVMSAGT